MTKTTLKFRKKLFERCCALAFLRKVAFQTSLQRDRLVSARNEDSLFRSPWVGI